MTDKEDAVKALRKISRNEIDIEQQLKAEISKELEEIEALKSKAEERRKRQEEDARKEAEEKVRIEAEKRHKEEEEKRRKEELAQKKRQQELKKFEAEKKKLEQQIGMVSVAGGSKLGNILKAKEDMQKSPEQLEKEKREIIASRIPRLKLDGTVKDELIKQAENFYEILLGIHSQIYDLTEKHDRQKYDMMELAERARQIEKGKAKTRKSNIVHTGLGGSVVNLQETFPHAPQKISLFSRYERVTDRRTFKDRRELFGIKEKKEIVLERPKAKIKNVDAAQLSAGNRRKKPAADAPAEEEHHEEEAPAEEEHQEEAPAEEAAEEE